MVRLIARSGPGIKVKEGARLFLCAFALENYFTADASDRARCSREIPPVAPKLDEGGRRAPLPNPEPYLVWVSVVVVVTGLRTVVLSCVVVVELCVVG